MNHHAGTVLVIAAAITPLGGIFARPLAIVGAILVLFALVVAGIECQTRHQTR
jgi:hypothetical protein